jgi:hypothetical protein
MAISYSKVDIRGKAVEPVFAEILFKNNTIGKGLVNFQENIKADTIVTENGMTVAMQAYTSGAPSASGAINLYDKSITPTKIMYYDEFDPETLRSSRFNRDMAAGAWNLGSSEFENLVMTNYSGKIANDVESKFWNNATAATKTAVAALTAGTAQTSVSTAEQALVAATTAGLFDGVVTTMIYNTPYQGASAGVGGRVKVVGTTVDGTNIAAEYAKVYAAIPSRVLNGNDEAPLIYAPYSHKQFINIYNSAATYRDLFSVTGLGTANETYFYNGIKIEFVPLPEKVIVCAIPSNILWLTDLQSDISTLVIDKIANNREDRFIKAIMTQYAWIVRQSMNVLYVG